jgi:phage N-6-adenine-methyltransferase
MTTALDKYNPEKGLRTIAVAKVAEAEYARAKDATGLQRAIRAKLAAQAEFVAWWDTQAKKHGGDTRSAAFHRDRSVTMVAGVDGLPTRKVIQRWRQKLGTDDRFERTYQEACSRYARILEFAEAAHVAHNSGNNEWYTPPAYVEAARAVLGGFDLDPASSPAANQIVQAAQYFTRDDDGLTQPWHGRVWMNPPYAPPLLGQFVNRLVEHIKTGDVAEAIVLVNNATETDWFLELAEVASLICFPSSRVKFWQPGTDERGAPLQGQAILYLGSEHASKFWDAFREIGLVVVLAVRVPSIVQGDRV